MSDWLADEDAEALCDCVSLALNVDDVLSDAEMVADGEVEGETDCDRLALGDVDADNDGELERVVVALDDSLFVGVGGTDLVMVP